MASNIVEVATEAINAVGASDADWRVQAGVAAILIVAGVGLIGLEQIRGRIKKWRNK